MKASKTKRLAGEEQSRKRLRQQISHRARLNWSHWTELVGGREWRPHAPRGAKSNNKKKIHKKGWVL